MSELLELRLEVLPGKIKATGSLGTAAAEGAGRRNSKPGAGAEEQVQRAVFTLNLPEWPAGLKNEVLRRLSAHPGELYDLLQGSLNEELAALAPLPADAELEQAAHEQGTGSLPAEELLLRVKQQLKKEPLLAFALRGLSKEELLAGVFALWAEVGNGEDGEGTRDASGLLAAELARLERKGPAVPSGEWLAEAAAEGSLHQPGPLFHEIEARPLPVIPVVAEIAENWASLLPQTPRATEGLALIMRQVAEAAARRAGSLNRK
ncbi:hypothetical protein KC345_g9044 [Hortaea werneckii]|nr:hypothetical protein KC345_g9044 [Hortaea werneckii]